MPTIAHPQLPWFLPLAGFMAWVGVRTTHGLAQREGRRGADIWIARLLTWFPLVIWLLSQLVASSSDLP